VLALKRFVFLCFVSDLCVLVLQKVNGEVENGVAPAAKAEDDSLPAADGDVVPVEKQNGVKEEEASSSSPDKPKKDKKKKKFSFRSISFSRKDKKAVAKKDKEVSPFAHPCFFFNIPQIGQSSAANCSGKWKLLKSFVDINGRAACVCVIKFTPPPPICR
jgi:hypothetical protein